MRQDAQHARRGLRERRPVRELRLTFRAGGLLFAVEPEGALGDRERAALEAFDPPGAADGESPFRIEIVPTPPWTSDDPGLYPAGEPPVIRSPGGASFVATHRLFTVAVDPRRALARLYRDESGAYGLRTAIRMSMLTRSPFVGALPLHAAGVSLPAGGVAFFGPSGAGKTTLASSSPHPVLSDELVVARLGEPAVLVRSGFWGEGSGPPASEAPLAALVELGQGPRFTLERLRPAEALRRLLEEVALPLGPCVGGPALAVAAALVQSVPSYRMEWTPSEPPWARLDEVLRG